jgi:hypothetical protein
VSDVELVATVTRVAGGGRDGVRTLPELAIGDDADRHVLAGLEGDRISVELDPEVGQFVRVIDSSDEGGVVLGGGGVDDAVVAG